MRHGIWMGLAAVVVMAVLGGLAWQARARAADTATQLQRENEELRQMLAAYGSGTVDVHLAGAVGPGAVPTINGAKPLRATVVHGTVYHRFRTEDGDVHLVRPDRILSVRVPAGNLGNAGR